ncbi:MAG: efflux RND transporter periplasmic adaptor subunit [Flavobacteriales bacterium]|nr:efflux RND transporter periplasmic adaptor subunit [Flavobacteriales bacterium]
MKRIYQYSILAFIFIGLLSSCSETPEQEIAGIEAEIKELNQTIKESTQKSDSLSKVLENLKKGLPAEEESLLKITSYEIQQKDFDHYFTVQGNIETDKNAQVFPEAQGVVKSIFVKEGQKVTKGQKLMSLDMDVIYQNIKEVETSYELAKDIFERQERLWEQKIGSEVQYLEAKNRKESLEATLATLRTQAAMGVVKSPFSGVVDQVVPKIGEMASPAMPVARVVSLNEMYVTSQDSEYYSGKVEEGMPVIVVVPGMDTLKTVIERVGQYINPENRTFEVMVGLDKESKFKPNMYAALEINDISMDSVSVIPSSMIQQDAQNREYVYIIRKEGENSSTHKQIIQTGPSYNAETVLLGGLKAGDLIVDRGSRKVIDGQTVEVTE